MNYRAVIFDLDGTLINSIEDLGNAVNQSLTKYGFPSHEIVAYKYFIGSGAEAMVTRALPESCRDSETIKVCLKLFNEIYDKTFNVKTRLYDEIPQLLDKLKELDYKIAILTNKPYQFTMKFVEELLSEWEFDIVLGNYEGLPKKPDPTGAKKITEHFGLDPSEIVYLGDSDVDMITAEKAGFLPVGVLWGFRDSEELLSSGAKHLIKNPLELMNIISE